VILFEALETYKTKNHLSEFSLIPRRATINANLRRKKLVFTRAHVCFFKDRHLLRYEHDGSLMFISAQVVLVLSF
jgi:hypothetical protein